MTRISGRRLPPLLAAIALMMEPHAGRAQAVDQTALEQLVGEPVTTSATGKPQRVSEVPAEMTIVSAADISRSGAQTIPDALRFVPGLDVRSYGLMDSAVGIRGFNTALNPRVLVLLDGRQVYQDDYGLTAWSLIPVTLAEIRQIEIIKGPNAALYGFNAVDGVINIVTYDPLHDRVNAARVDLGTQSQTAAAAVATVQIPDRLGVRLSAQAFRSTEFPGEQGFIIREQPHSGMVALDTRLQVAPGVEWDVSASISSVDSDYYLDTGFYLPLGLKANSVSSRLSADTGAGLLQLNAFRNENRTSDSEPYDSSNWREDVVVVQASDLLKLGNHTLRIAAEYRGNTASSAPSFNGRIGYVNLAGSLIWDWRIRPWLTLTNAFREDDLSLSHHGTQFSTPLGDVYHPVRIAEPSFNSGAILKLSRNDVVRLTAARAVQLPCLVDFGLARDYGLGIVVGNTSLRPSALLSFGIDYDRALPALHSTLRLAVLAQRTDVNIGSPFGSGLNVLPNGQVELLARNVSGSSELGGEIGIKGSNAFGLRWNASYALAALRDSAPTALLLDAPSVSYQRQTPVASVILGGGYSWGKFEADTQARWQSHFDDFALDPDTFEFTEVKVRNYVTVNARIAYRLTRKITLSVVAQQLNQHSIVESAGLHSPRRLIAGIDAHF